MKIDRQMMPMKEMLSAAGFTRGPSCMRLAGHASLVDLLESAKMAVLDLATRRRNGGMTLSDALALEIAAAAELVESLAPLSARWMGDAEDLAASTAARLPETLGLLLEDARAAMERDPAAHDLAEVILSYPGFEAIAAHRLAHPLELAGLPLLPRLLTETAHSRTGIDLHPGAVIGRGFFIDHGTGTVVGETTEIGDDVTLYQGVTLGALSFARDAKGRLVHGFKRHPTVRRGAVIYSHATVLGGGTIIGECAVIGARAFVTRSVPPGATMLSSIKSHHEGCQ